MSRFLQGQLQRVVQHSREPQLQSGLASQAAITMAQGSLQRGREASWQAAGGRRQVPHQTQISAAAHHLGWRGDVLLFQGEVEKRAAGLVHSQPLPVAEGEARAGRSDRLNHDTGLQLVQKQTTKRQSRRGQG